LQCSSLITNAAIVAKQVMGTQLRKDILMNLPALRKLDAMLLVGSLRKFLLGVPFRTIR
jgi:hypothetical protein